MYCTELWTLAPGSDTRVIFEPKTVTLSYRSRIWSQPLGCSVGLSVSGNFTLFAEKDLEIQLKLPGPATGLS